MSEKREPHYLVELLILDREKPGIKKIELARTYPLVDAEGVYRPHPLHEVLRMAADTLEEKFGMDDSPNPDDILGVTATNIS